MALLTSAWDGLNPHLLAYFFECDKDGVQVGDTIVRAPATEFNLDMSLNWQSPFEQSGPESMKPSMFAMIQSGEVDGILDQAKPIIAKNLGDKAGNLVDSARSAAKSVEGRTPLTKLNSIQTFASMPPVKAQITLLFRAWSNAASEVEAPVDQLIAWSLPVQLARDGVIANNLKAVNSGGSAQDFADANLPSLSPVMVGITYKTRTYAPMVIENLSLPLGGPVTRNGQYKEMVIPVTVCSLSAWDRADYAKTRG
ncbi:MAG: hypothetical protein ACR2HF_04745 [Methylococcaceae bacterium]